MLIATNIIWKSVSQTNFQENFHLKPKRWLFPEMTNEAYLNTLPFNLEVLGPNANFFARDHTFM